MNATPHAPKHALPPAELSARHAVRAFVVADLVSIVAFLLWLGLSISFFYPLAVGVFLLPLLVLDMGAWDFEAADLRKRRWLSYLGLLVGALGLVRYALRDLYVVFGLGAGALLLLSIAAAVVCTRGLRVLARRREVPGTGGGVLESAGERAGAADMAGPPPRGFQFGSSRRRMP